MTSKICDFYNNAAALNDKQANSLKYMQTLDCRYLSNDTTRFLKTLEEKYFEKKDGPY